MIYLLFAWLVTSFITVSVGTIVIDGYHKWARVPATYSIFDRFFVGLCLCGTFACAWSLFLPVDVFALLFLLAVVAVYWIANRGKAVHYARLVDERSSFRTWLLIPGVLIFLTILISAVNVPVSYDTYLYHLQSILWTENYPAVPGLANVHRRFGFNSNVLMLNTLFSFKSLYGQHVFIVNSLTLLFFSSWLIRLSFTKSGLWGLVAVILLYLFFSFYVDEISSASTDLAPNLICVYVLVRLLTDERPFQESSLVYVVLPIIAVTMKISMFPIALLVPMVILGMSPELMWRKITMVVVLGLLITIPWLARNVILTGYLVFPFTALDVFEFDWKVPRDLALDIRNQITTWAMLPDFPMSKTLSMSRIEWFLLWWPSQSWTNKLIMVLSALSPLSCLVISRTARNTGVWSEKSAIVLVCLAVAYTGGVFWFLTAPTMRFSYAFLLILTVFPLIIFARLEVFTRMRLKWVSYAAMVIACLWLLISARTDELMTPDYIVSWLVSPRQRTASSMGVEFQEYKMAGEVMFVPVQGFQCYEKFPCTPEFMNLKMRSASFRSGFVNRLEDPSGAYSLKDGIVYRNGNSHYDETLKGQMALVLYTNSTGYAEFITSNGSVWNSNSAWLNTRALSDSTGFYYMVDGSVYKYGSMVYYAGTLPSDSLYINNRGDIEFMTVDGQKWNTRRGWLNK